MAKLNEFTDVVRDFAHIADFNIMYISEAHAADGWAFRNNPYHINKHVSVEERLLAAKILAEDVELPCPLYIDLLMNQAMTLYGAHPERLYIILNGRVVYQGVKSPFRYNPSEVRAWLEEYSKTLKKD